MKKYELSFNNSLLPTNPQTELEKYLVDASNTVDLAVNKFNFAKQHLEALQILIPPSVVTPTFAVDELKSRRANSQQRLGHIQAQLEALNITHRDIVSRLPIQIQQQGGFKS